MAETELRVILKAKDLAEHTIQEWDVVYRISSLYYERRKIHKKNKRN